MPFYLQDSGSVYWQLGVTTDGREQNSVVGSQSLVTLVVRDSAGGYWQLGITTAGRISPSSTSPAAVTSIVLADSNSQLWSLSVDASGRAILSQVEFQPSEDGYIPPMSGGWDSLVTVW